MMQGVEMVDAEVISLSTEIQISPNMTIDELRAALLAYEKSIFYEKTGFKKLTGCGSLDFTMPGRYDVIFEHILVHKYYLNLPQSGEVPFSDALISWYNTVYLPIIAIITEENLCSHFPQRTPSDLYVWIVKHWDELKKQYGIHYALSEAVRDFNARYGKSRGSVLSLIKGALSGILHKR
jgi:hypothetical protein